MTAPTESSVTRILNVLDAGLQRSVTERGYGSDLPGRCARCQWADLDTEGADLCTDCRSFLLGDTDTDPKVDGWKPPSSTSRQLDALCGPCTPTITRRDYMVMVTVEVPRAMYTRNPDGNWVLDA